MGTGSAGVFRSDDGGAVLERRPAAGLPGGTAPPGLRPRDRSRRRRRRCTLEPAAVCSSATTGEAAGGCSGGPERPGHRGRAGRSGHPVRRNGARRRLAQHRPGRRRGAPATRSSRTTTSARCCRDPGPPRRCTPRPQAAACSARSTRPRSGTASAAASRGSTSTRCWSIGHDPQRVFAGTNGGGLFRSTTGGDAWEDVSEGLLSLAVTSVALDGSTPPAVYVGTAEAGLFKGSGAAGRVGQRGEHGAGRACRCGRSQPIRRTPRSSMPSPMPWASSGAWTGGRRGGRPGRISPRSRCCRWRSTRWARRGLRRDRRRRRLPLRTTGATFGRPAVRGT